MQRSFRAAGRAAGPPSINGAPMKTNSTCELSRTWWSRERPKALTKSAAGFEKALMGYEKAHASIQDGATQPEIKGLKAAVAEILAASKDVVAEAKILARSAEDADARKELSNTIEVMGKPLQKRLDAVRSDIALLTETLANEGREKEDEDGEDGDALASPAAQAEYIRSFAGRLRRRRHNFALGVPSKDPTEMRFVFHAKKPAKSLASLVKSKAGAKAWVYGTAGTKAPEGTDTEDPAKPKILLLDIEGGKRIPGLARRVKLMFKRLGVSAFARVRILEAGVAVEDDETPPVEPAAKGAATAEAPAPGPETAAPADPVRARVLALLADGLERLRIPPGLPDETRDRLAAARALLEKRLATAETTDALAEIARAIDALKAAVARAVEEARGGDAGLAEIKKRLAELVRTLPGDLPPLRQAPGEVSKADALEAKGEEPEARKVLFSLVASLVKARDAVLSAVDRLLTEIFDLGDPAGATEAERGELEALRAEIRELLGAGVPGLGTLREAGRRLVALRARRDAIRRAAARRTAMAGFEAAIGSDAPVTDDLIADHENSLARARAAVAALEARLAEAEAMPAGTDAEQAARQAAIGEARGELEAARTLARQLETQLRAMRGKKGLTEALGHGALAPDSPNPLSDAAAAALIEAFTRDPALAVAASEAALTARHPDAVAEGVGALADLVESGFASEDGRRLPGGEAAARDYAEDLLRMGGHLGGDFFEDAAAYVAEGHHLEPDPVGDAAIDPTTGDGDERARKRAEIERKRAAHLAGALLDEEGQIDLDSETLERALGDLRFHPGQLEDQRATPALAAHIERTLETLADPASAGRAQAILDDAEAPTNPAALHLLRTATGKAAGDAVSDTETREVILAALMTPVTQAAVGSCFATAGVRRMAETDPLAFMAQLADIATTGVFTPANGDDPIPAVTRIPEGEDQLIRSLEYSVATAAARHADSIDRRELAQAFEAGAGQFRDALGRPNTADGDLEWEVDLALLRAGAARGFTFIYDSTEATAPAADGSSSQGVFKLVEVSTGTEITDRAGYVAALTRICLDALGPRNLSAEQEQAVRNLVASDAFITAVTAVRAPWVSVGGGFAETADDAIFGTAPDTTEILGADTTQTTHQRSQAVLAGLAGLFSGRAEAMLSLETQGIHAFNGLPNHPSLEPLKGATPADVAANVQTHLVDAGTAYRDAPLTEARTLQAYDASIALVRSYGFNAGARRGLIDAGAAANRPAGPLSPGAVAASLRAALDDAAEHWGDERALRERAEITASGAPYTHNLPGRKADWKRTYLDWCIDAAGDDLVDVLDPPKFTVADSNWGDGRNNVYFVIATNPLTGEAAMYQRTDPPGTMRQMGGSWLEKAWNVVE